MISYSADHRVMKTKEQNFMNGLKVLRRNKMSQKQRGDIKSTMFYKNQIQKRVTVLPVAITTVFDSVRDTGNQKMLYLSLFEEHFAIFFSVNQHIRTTHSTT